MMKNPQKLALLLFFFSTFIFAQKKIDPTPEDIQTAKALRLKYDKDDVAILESTENISFDLNKKDEKVIVFNNTTEQLMNINHRADISIYEFYDSQSKIEKMKLKYRNDKEAYFAVNDQYMKDDDLFYVDARVKFLNVDFPVQGYTYNYEMEKKYEDAKYFTSLYFNNEYPVIKKTIVFTIPDWLNIELKEFNFDNKILKTKTIDAKNKTTVYTFTLENIPALSKENNAPGRSYIYPHILIIAKSFKNKEKEVTLFNSVTDLYKWYKSLVDSMKDDTTTMAEKVKELTANAKTDEEKIKNIYYWVQDNIRYIAFEDGIAGFKPDESNNVFDKRFGDCKGMANLNKQMLKLAGFDARLTWIGTKHINYDYTTPSLAIDNHMICTLFHKGKKFYIDGTEKYNSLGEYAERIQNKEVMIEDGDKYIIDKVPISTAEANKEISKLNFVIENEKLKGKCNRVLIGESRSQFLYNYNTIKNDKKENILEKYLSNSDKNIHLTNIKTSDLKNRDLVLNIDYDITIDNKVSSFDNDIYVGLENGNMFTDFDKKDRKTTYQFDYKTNLEKNITLSIPEGYKVSKLPENLSIKEKDYEIEINYQQTAKAIIYKRIFIFKTAEIKMAEMTKWYENIKNINKINNQQITLTKQ